MMSKSSLWINMKENCKRRMGIIAITSLIQFFYFPMYLIMYYSRIKTRYNAGYYNTEELFKLQMKEATFDALCFNEYYFLFVIGLAMLIGIQGYSYVYSRRKLDLYMSVPVDAKNRFFIIYVNGLSIYLFPQLIGILMSVLIAISQNAMDGMILGKLIISYLMQNVLFFAVYNVVILAVMITGNILITIACFCGMLFLGEIVSIIISSYKDIFFITYQAYFGHYNYGTGIYTWYFNSMNEILMNSSMTLVLPLVLAAIGKLLGVAVLGLLLSFFTYRRRTAEAAGKAICFPILKYFVKFFVIIITALAAGAIFYSLSEQNVVFLIVGLIGAGLLTGMIIEAVFAYDVKASVKHLFSTVFSVMVAGAIFAIFYFDLIGYDSYIPKVDQIESYAISYPNVVDYQNYYMLKEDGESIYIGLDEYITNYMYLEDAEAIVKLAEKNVAMLDEVSASEKEINTPSNYIYCPVLYRLKSGRCITRILYIDVNDESNVAYLNRIMGQNAFLKGVFQVCDDVSRESVAPVEAAYTVQNYLKCEMKVSDLEDFYQIWVQDMQKHFDYTLISEKKEIGFVAYRLKQYDEWNLPVYENFYDTIAWLENKGYYIPMLPEVSDIECVMVTNYNSDLYEDPNFSELGVDPTMTETYDQPEDIAQILKALYPSDLNYNNWKDGTVLTDMHVQIQLKDDCDYPQFEIWEGTYIALSEQFPEYVIEDTTYQY